MDTVSEPKMKSLLAQGSHQSVYYTDKSTEVIITSLDDLSLHGNIEVCNTFELLQRSMVRVAYKRRLSNVGFLAQMCVGVGFDVQICRKYGENGFELGFLDKKTSKLFYDNSKESLIYKKISQYVFLALELDCILNRKALPSLVRLGYGFNEDKTLLVTKCIPFV